MTDELILQETQAMLDERLKLLDEQMASFAGLTAPTRAIETEAWFRKQIATALQPLLARLDALERKPMPTAIATKPPPAFIDAVGAFIADELKERDQRILQLESKLAAWKYCGIWSAGQYETGNFVTHGGSLWTCLWTTQAEPGTVDAWQLACKKGKNAKDLHADDARRPSHR